jgi:hypothetical protein
MVSAHVYSYVPFNALIEANTLSLDQVWSIRPWVETHVWYDQIEHGFQFAWLGGPIVNGKLRIQFDSWANSILYNTTQHIDFLQLKSIFEQKNMTRSVNW